MAKTLEKHKNKKLSKRVLLVEDDVDVNDAFSILLAKGGYEVLGAYNGKEALEKIPSFNPEVILLDLLMPIMDGNEFLRTYNNDDHIPIIVFSSLDSRTEVETALQLGATRYMLKAWATPEELFRVINDAV